MNIQELLETMQNPQMRHAALVHMPIALSLLGLPVLIALVWSAGRNITLRWGAVAAYGLLAAAAFVAMQSGDAAEGGMGKVSDEIHKLAHEHEEMAEKVWWMAIAVAALAGAAWVRQPLVARGGPIVATLLGVFLAGWLAQTAHLGGTLVYSHGVGPKRAATTSVAGDNPGGDPRIAFFRQKIYPLLDESCIGCHGGREPAADLDLSTGAAAMKGGESGPAIKPGDAAASLLYAVVSWEHPEIRMPKKEPQLSAEKIAAIKSWIEDGAVWGE